MSIYTILHDHTALVLVCAGCLLVVTCAAFGLVWIIRQNRKEREKWAADEKLRQEGRDWYIEWDEHR